MKNKKSTMVITTTVLLVLFIVTLILIFGIWAWIKYFFYSSGELGIDRTSCAMSVITQANTRGTKDPMPFFGMKQSVFELKCPRYLIKFYNDKATFRTAQTDEQPYTVLSKGDVVQNFDGLTNEVVNYVISEEIRLCWFQFHEGKQDIFNEKFWDPFNNDKVCFICDEISFDPEVLTEVPGNFTGFWKYINTIDNAHLGTTLYKHLANDDHLCAPTYKGNPTCFEGYATNTLGGSDKNRQPIELDLQFNPAKRYVVFFVRQGLESDKQEQTYFTYVIEASKLSNQCNTYVI